MASLTSFVGEDASDTVEGATETLSDSIAILLGSLNKYSCQDSCHEVSVMVYAAAGMRMMEYQNTVEAMNLWGVIRLGLEDKLASILPDRVRLNFIEVRTITGFEEGLYAWLAIAQYEKDVQFGIVEMGGASA